MGRYTVHNKGKSVPVHESVHTGMGKGIQNDSE